jgi:CRISPR system Cascade subunit CasD
MSNDEAYLTMFLDAPLQSWGYESRFQRRTTGLYPTKSGAIGLICAAMGLAKGSASERDMLPRLAGLKMSTLVIPRRRMNTWTGVSDELDVHRIEDFHTVLGTRRASGKMNPHPVVSRRQYLQEARFGLILAGDRKLLEQVADALQNPRWGVWLGRKSCIAAEPILRGIYSTRAEAQHGLIGDAPPSGFTWVSEVERFADGTDSINDQPLSFGEGTSSGPDGRRFAPRRVSAQPRVSTKSK